MLPLCRQGTVPLLTRELPLCWYPLCYPWKRRLKDGYCFTFTSTVFVWSWNIWIWVTKLCFFFLIVTDPDLLFLKTIEKSITLWQAMKRFNCPPFVAIEKNVIISMVYSCDWQEKDTWALSLSFQQWLHGQLSSK